MAEGVIFCLAYCVGLLGVSLLVHDSGWELLPGVFLSGLGLLGVGVVAAIALPRKWRLGPSAPVYLLAGLLALSATFYYWGRSPIPAIDDISRLLDRGEQAGAEQVIWGTVKDAPELTRSGRTRFWLQAKQVRPRDERGDYMGEPEAVSGNLYITIASDRADGVFPGQALRLGGNLYAPSRPKNPNGFDFKTFLADKETFAGFSADWLKPEDASQRPGLGLWRLRQRIAAAHQQGLGLSVGPLVSAMALGRRAVNLPYDIQDAFIQAGLAHTLAASGFHVSLVLGVMLGLFKGRNPKLQVAAGAIALVIYVGLTGAQPSVMRAALMGAGALIGLAVDRRVKPLGCLLMAVTILLMGQPHWIDSIGFRLSVAATFGLIVTVQPLTRWLDFLPSAMAPLLAVPVAAYLWTIPLQLYYFNTLSTYSILLNMAVTPLVMVISLGGIATGMIAAILPPLGSLLAWPLQWPSRLLIAIVQWSNQQPGSSLATGHLSLAQMVGLYGLFLLGWRQPWFQRRRWLVGCTAVMVAIGPLWLQTSTTFQATVLAAGRDPVLVAQDYHQTLLVNSGEAKTAFYTVNPFLKQAGKNRLDWAIALPHNSPDAWRTITAQTPVNQLYSAVDIPATADVKAVEPLKPGEPQTFGRFQLQSLGAENSILQLTLPEDHPWLLLLGLSIEAQKQLAKAATGLASEVLWWDGGPLADELLDVVQPQTAIASGYEVDDKTETVLSDRAIQLFITERDGAVLWTPTTGFEGYLRSRKHRRTPQGLL